MKKQYLRPAIKTKHIGAMPLLVVESTVSLPITDSNTSADDGTTDNGNFHKLAKPHDVWADEWDETWLTE